MSPSNLAPLVWPRKRFKLCTYRQGRAKNFCLRGQVSALIYLSEQPLHTRFIIIIIIIIIYTFLFDKLYIYTHQKKKKKLSIFN